MRQFTCELDWSQAVIPARTARESPPGSPCGCSDAGVAIKAGTSRQWEAGSLPPELAFAAVDWSKAALDSDGVASPTRVGIGQLDWTKAAVKPGIAAGRGVSGKVSIGRGDDPRTRGPARSAAGAAFAPLAAGGVATVGPPFAVGPLGAFGPPVAHGGPQGAATSKKMTSFLGTAAEGDVCVIVPVGADFVTNARLAKKAFELMFSEYAIVAFQLSGQGFNGAGFTVNRWFRLEAGDLEPVDDLVADLDALRGTPEGRYVIRDFDLRRLEDSAADGEGLRDCGCG